MQNLCELFQETDNCDYNVDDDAVEYAALRAGEEQGTCTDDVYFIAG